MVWEKTAGRCHFCGKKLIFSAKRGSPGRWNVDHVVPIKQGGGNSLKNYLAICRACNRLRWYLNSKRIRKTYLYGVIAFREVKHKTDLGKILRLMYNARKKFNKERRKN